MISLPGIATTGFARDFLYNLIDVPCIAHK